MIGVYDESGVLLFWFMNQEDYDHYKATGLGREKGWTLDEILAHAG